MFDVRKLVSAPRPRGLRSWLLLLLILPTLSVCTAQGQLETIPLSIGEHELTVEVADSEIERARGLMYRKEMDDDHGMLFVFEDSRPRSFWMKNTFIPLSIAYLGEDRKILNFHDMAPQNSDKHYRSAGPARYALEVNQGWFAEQGIKVGDTVQFQLK